MKKSLLALILCLCLAVGMMVYTSAGVNKSIRTVEVTETVLLGDAADAEGVEMRERFTLPEGNLMWDVTYRPGQTEEAETTVYNRGEEPYWYDSWYGIDVAVPSGYGYVSGDPNAYVDPSDPYYQIWNSPELQDAYSRLEETGRLNETIRLLDYYDYYPLEWSIDLPGYDCQTYEYNLRKNEERSGELDVYDRERLEEYRAIDEGFRRFFRFPVREEDSLNISIFVNEDEWYEGDYTVNREVGLSTVGVAVEKCCYFTFLTSNDEADFSEVPGGLGVYRLPFDGQHFPEVHLDEDGNEVTESVFEAEKIRTDCLKNVWSFPEGEKAVSMAASKDKKTVFLLTIDGKQNRLLTVFDAKTAEVLQRIPLKGSGDHIDTDEVYCDEDFAVIRWSDNTLTLVTRSEEGWKEEFCAPLRGNDCLQKLPSSDLAYGGQNFYNVTNYFDWDGSRLAIFGVSGFCQYVRYSSLDVVDAGGSRFIACYRTSISEPMAVDGERYNYYDMGNHILHSDYDYAGRVQFLTK